MVGSRGRNAIDSASDGAVLDIAFGLRVALVLALLGVATGVELLVRRQRAVRWRGALVIVGAGLLGAAIGTVNDAITAAISPEDFAIGKQLGFSADLQLRACALGARAGTSAGTIAGCALTWFAIRRDREPAPLRTLALARFPIAAAVLTALVVAGLAAAFAPTDVAARLGYDLAPAARRPFATVWAAHVGLYTGAVVGLVVAVRRAVPKGVISYRV